MFEAAKGKQKTTYIFVKMQEYSKILLKEKLFMIIISSKATEG